MLDWRVSEDLTLSLTGTFYGKQKPRRFNPNLGNAVTEADELRDREAYDMWGVVGTYELNENFSFATGINNLFDERLYREGAGTNAGANIYNEPGRAYYASITAYF